MVKFRAKQALLTTVAAFGIIAALPGEAKADPMDAICYAAGIGATVWPIGTLIAGPTVIGCILHYAAQ